MLRSKNEGVQDDLNIMMQLYRFVSCLCVSRRIPGPNFVKVLADTEQGRRGPGPEGYPIRRRS